MITAKFQGVSSTVDFFRGKVLVATRQEVGRASRLSDPDHYPFSDLFHRHLVHRHLADENTHSIFRILVRIRKFALVF